MAPETKEQRRHDRYDYATLIFAALAAAAAVAVAVLTQCALADARRSAREQHLDNVNTLKTADAALSASNAAGDAQAAQANEALAIASNSATAAATSADASKLSAGALSGQLAEMKDAERAWVKVDEVSVRQPSGPYSPDGLYFPAVNFPGSFGLHIVVKNVGRAPAYNVRVGTWSFFGHQDRSIDIEERERRGCASLDTYPTRPMLADNLGYAPIIFQGDPSNFDENGVFVPYDRMIEVSRQNNNEFQLWFYGCVRYTLGYSKTSEPHNTVFVYRVGHRVITTNGLAADEGFKPMENVPASGLFLEPRPLAEGITN